MKRKILCVVLTLLVAFAFAACGSSNKTVKLQYHDYGPSEPNLPDLASNASEIEYNQSLFYRNDLTSLGADPSAIYVTEGEEKGYFYMYATSDQIGGAGYQCWRSKDLVNWECRGVAYKPERTTWGLVNYWAPEVIYDEGKYFMYYCADRMSNGVKCMGLAVSDTPYGPFKQYVNEEKGITMSTPLFDFTKMDANDPLTEKDGSRKRPMKVIDASPYKDPDTGEKYMYFVHDLGGGGDCNHYNESSIYVIKMTDWYTPDYTQVRKLTTPNCLTEDGAKTALNEGSVNEAPFMYKYDGKYYLTFSANGYTEKAYSVRVAVGDNPMGPFTKLTQDEGGWLLYAEGMGDHASGTGHHSFAAAGDELFIIYHAHVDRDLGNSARAIAGDRVMFIKNSAGDTVPYVNGPTFSLQPLAAEVSGYKNIAPEATAKATNVKEGSDAKYLNDNLVKYHENGMVQEFEANGDSVITLTFDKYRTTRAIMVYNSFDFNLALGAIAKIELQFKSGKTEGTAYTDALLYDWASYASPGLLMRAGGSFAIEYADLQVKKITITVKNGGAPFNLSDIVVLGK